MQKPVYFVHISDTHIGPTADYQRHGHRSLPRAQQIVTLINQLPQPPDFVVHTGDIVTDPDPIAYQQAAEVFAALSVPIYYVTGNHDRACDIRHHLPMGEHEALDDDPDRLSYRFEVRGEQFLVVDSRAPDELDPQGLISAPQLQLVGDQLRTDAKNPLTLFVHHPIWPLNAPWIDAHMLMINGRKLHDLLRETNRFVRGVFHGHVHQHLQIVRDGILYVSVASTFAQFASWPDDVTIQTMAEPPGFNFVHLLPAQTIVRQHTFF